MAQHHQNLLDAGVRVFGVSVDTPGQQAAMVDKLDLPFPMLSDPDRTGIITPFGLADPDDPREISRPALVLIGPGEQQELWRWVSRDYADRLPEVDAVAECRQHGWAPTTQPTPEVGPIEPGDKAVSVAALVPYLRGAKFAAIAMGKRHRHLDLSVKADSIAFAEEMDRYLEAIAARRQDGSS